MNGRLEKELSAEKKMHEKLKTLPKIFSEYYTYLRAAKKTYTTIGTYINYVVHFAKYLGDNEINNDFYKIANTSDIEGYIISLETKEVQGQLQRVGSDIQCARWSGLNTFFEFCIKRNYLAENPVAKTTRPKNTSEHAVTYLTRPEIKRIMNAIDKNSSNIMKIRDKTIVSLALSTGMRVGAIVNLNVEDLNFDEQAISVIEKGNKSRSISIGENAVQLLKDWIVVRNREFAHVNTNALFISRKNVRITSKAVGDMIKKYTTEAGINKHITPHKCRSSAATNLAASGVSIQAIAKQLGHSNISVTQRYVDVLKEEQAKTVKVLDNLF
jgi:site-specific recombinase XerD